MEFERVVGNKKDYLPLLLLADEQEDMIAVGRPQTPIPFSHSLFPCSKMRCR